MFNFNLKNVLKFIAGDPNKKDVQRYAQVAGQINALEATYRQLSAADLRAKTAVFRARLAEALADVTDPEERHEVTQATLDDLLPEAFAAVREAAMRTIGLRPFDVQLIGGQVIHAGRIAEMKTGEGKTLVAALPTYLNALAGRGVHVITVNDYLARRDARWMGPIYHTLGLSVGILQEAARTENGKKAFLYVPEERQPKEEQDQLRLVDRREAYAADITYGTNNEFGFDYLRDNMAFRLDDRVQRERYFAIVDEVDNILIDEARTPLIISGPSQEDPKLYYQIARVVKQLKPEDYTIDERNRSIALTESGEARLEKLLATPLRDPDRPEEVTPEQARLLGHIEQGLRAEFLFKRDKDYLVQNGQVVIVDEFTGRMMVGRRWSDGLHQAVEAKEGVTVEQDNVTYATITLQNYFRMYAKLGGMTGTALTEAEEFEKIYKLTVVAVPTNLEYQLSLADSGFAEIAYKEEGHSFKYFARKNDPEKKPIYWRRKDYPDMVYRTEEAKLRAIIIELLRRHLHGQPLLIGTTSVEASEHLNERLRPQALQMLARILLLRDAWFRKNNKEEDGMVVEALRPLDAPFAELSKSELDKQMREYDLSTNPYGDDNLQHLVRILGVDDSLAPTLAQVLQAGIKNQVLNAKEHTRESLVIADAGKLGAVTIATNMAGRGVDIKLGGELSEEVLGTVNRILREAGGINDPSSLNNHQRREALQSMDPAHWGEAAEACRTFLQMMDEAEKVRAVGGLHVVGSERHESRRIDNQLRGRAARQGDPGSSQFFLSLQDDLMRRFGGQGVSDLMQRLRVDDNVPIAAGIVNRTIEQSQTRVEGSNFDIRKHLLEYDDVLNIQRKTVYAQRDRVFAKDDLTEDFEEMLQAEVQRRADLATKGDDERWKLFSWLETSQPIFGLADGSVYPSYLLDVLARELDDQADARVALLDLAKDAIAAERQYLLIAIEQQIDRAEERLADQIKEKVRQAELLLEELENQVEETGQPIEGRAAYRALNEALGAAFSGDTRDFDYSAFKKRIPDWAETAVSNRARASLRASIERRLNTALDMNNLTDPDLTWDTLRQQLLQAVTRTLTGRGDKALQEIERELKAALPEQATRQQKIIALFNTQWGRALEFDARSHRRVEKRTRRLTYDYLAGQMIADWTAADLTEDVLRHLHGAAEAQRRAWGFAFLRDNPNANPALLPPAQAQALRKHGLEAAVASVPTLGQLQGDLRDQASLALGESLLNDFYRQVMLQVSGNLWMEYLTHIEALRTSIGLEAYAQRDPLVAYKSKAFAMFKDLMTNMRADVVGQVFRIVPAATPPPAAKAPEAAPATAPATAPVAAPATARAAEPSLASAVPAELTASETAEAERKRKRRRR